MMKTRFCPSPTGHMHLGNARTALFNALYAHGHQGTFLLRIEDTDQARSQRILADELMADLQWLHMLWQEGPGVEGPNGPYWQSERHMIYDKYYQQLIDDKLVYPCFCSDDELALQRKIQLAASQPPRYPGTCRDLTQEQILQRLAAGQKPTLRFRVPLGQVISFDDFVRGQQNFQSDTIGDFIIRRADGSSSFIFCNAIDDALMGVTVALRGEDHLANTPRQLLVLQALGLKAPRYGHIALILGSDGAPLSKRNGSMSVAELRAEGYLPAAVINYLARLGHSYESNDWLDSNALAKNFDLNRLGHAPARFDHVQLLYWQREAILRLSHKEFHLWAKTAIDSWVPEDKQQAFIDAVKGNVLFPREVEQFAKIFFSDEYLSEEAKLSLENISRNYFEQALALWPQENFKQFTQQLGQTLNIKGKVLFEPLRLALTGQTHGPEMAPIVALLGNEKITVRFNKALNLAKA